MMFLLLFRLNELQHSEMVHQTVILPDVPLLGLALMIMLAVTTMPSMTTLTMMKRTVLSLIWRRIVTIKISTTKSILRMLILM